MDIFSKDPLSLKHICFSYLKLYRKAFLKTFPITILLGAITTALTVLKFMHQDHTIDSKAAGLLAPLILLLIMPYLSSLFILNTFHIGKKQHITLKEMLTYINQRYFKILIATAIASISYSLGFQLLVIPGIFLMVLFIMVQPLILLDNHGIIDSLTKSSKLVWGNWWRTFAIASPFILIHFSTTKLITDAFSAHDWSSVILIGLTSAVALGMLYASVLIMLNDLKLRKNEANIINVDVNP